MFKCVSKQDVSPYVSMWITSSYTMLVCGDLVSNMEAYFLNRLNSLFSHVFCTFWNGIVTPAFCGKKTLAICTITPVIIKNVVKRTYADFNGRFITVISACNEQNPKVCIHVLISEEKRFSIRPMHPYSDHGGSRHAALNRRMRNNHFQPSKYASI